MRHTKGMSIRALCVLVVLVSSCFINTVCQADETDKILMTAETFFRALRSEDFVKTWSLLSARSKDRIVDDICDEMRPSTGECRKERVVADLTTGGEISCSYWKAFLCNFNPNKVLEDSRWEMGYVRTDMAEVILTYKKSVNAAYLQMLKEGAGWKVGLVETFWARK